MKIDSDEVRAKIDDSDNDFIAALKSSTLSNIKKFAYQI